MEMYVNKYVLANISDSLMEICVRVSVCVFSMKYVAEYAPRYGRVRSKEILSRPSIFRDRKLRWKNHIFRFE